MIILVLVGLVIILWQLPIYRKDTCDNIVNNMSTTELLRLVVEGLVLILLENIISDIIRQIIILLIQ